MIIFSILFINNINVFAESATFYEGEYIDGVYMNRYQQSTKTTFYQKARFFRKSGTNEFAYCVEPFAVFYDNKNYESTLNPYNLSPNQIDRISKIAYFGYGYKHHTEPYWYAITQLMIWETADYGGNYYFTNGLNGSRTSIYANQMREIDTLVSNYNRLPSMANQNYTFVKDHTEWLFDFNDMLDYYKTNNEEVIIRDNMIDLNNLDVGEHSITLSRTENIYQKPIIFYQNAESQNLMKTGDLQGINTSFKVNIIETSITVKKIDKDSMDTTPSGEAELDGAIYSLYDNSMNEITEFEITDNKYEIKNINFGTYYIKEKTPGTGYTLNDKIYEVKITKENNNVTVISENEVIKKKIILEKKYGEKDNFQGEKNIDFEIFNNKGELVKTISTDEEGLVEVILPFGKYEFVQKNTTKGYNKVDPFKVIVNDTEEEKIELKDYKIPVPNTKTTILEQIIMILLSLLIIYVC